MKINDLRYSSTAVLTSVVVLGMAALSFYAYHNWQLSPATKSATMPSTLNNTATDPIRFMENRVKQDPEDFVALNKLAGYYLQRLRETGNVAYIDLTARAARASLTAVPAEVNSGGLAALAQTEFASHNFAAARDHALQLTKLDPGKSYPYQMLGDALLELGNYEQAIAAFKQMEQRNKIGGSVSVETRQARLALLQGNPDSAQQHFSNALAFARNLPLRPPETLAWCHWQLGETAFAIGNYEIAEQHYRNALMAFHGYFNALASLGRVRAARGDLPGAIQQYEEAVRRLPDPTFVAALGDLYKLAGNEKDAAAQYALVEEIGHLSVVNGTLYNRQLALFYADHNLKPEVAYTNAKQEYAVRRDIYGADALAWTALKAGKLTEAQVAIKQALRLGTQDAKLFYHAGMIARAAGDQAAAHDFLQRALTLNPQFDPLQAVVAKKALAE